MIHFRSKGSFLVGDKIRVKFSLLAERVARSFGWFSIFIVFSYYYELSLIRHSFPCFFAKNCILSVAKAAKLCLKASLWFQTTKVCLAGYLLGALWWTVFPNACLRPCPAAMLHTSSCCVSTPGYLWPGTASGSTARSVFSRALRSGLT